MHRPVTEGDLEGETVRERAYERGFWQEIGKRLLKARRARGITQTQVARRLGLGHQNVLQAEKGVCRIPLDRLISWCLFVGVDPVDLVKQLMENHPELGDRKETGMRKWTTFTERMNVTVPVGEYDGLRVEKFEVVDPDDWTEEHEKRTDVISPLEYVRLMRDERECKPGWYTRLVDANVLDDNGRPMIWMSDTTAERGDHREAVAAIQMDKSERVLINGLGLGMVLAAALTYDHVKHVDVVEKDERVIKLIGPHYTTDPRVNIIHADAYEQARAWPKGTRWGVAWSDIWPYISSENLPGMDQLHKAYRRRTNYHGMWCRKMCLDLRRELRQFGLA